MVDFPPSHAGHTFLGYRGVSMRHFTVGANKAIAYRTPPADVAGAAQLDAGVYVTSILRDALDYALDSAWNLHSSKYKSVDVDDDNARGIFERGRWTLNGRIHAVFMPTAKYESSKAQLADFSHVNIDRTGDFIRDNMMNYVQKNRDSIWGVKTQLFGGFQTVIYPPHIGSLFVMDITDDAVKHLAA